jgi:proteasome accessory factor A
VIFFDSHLCEGSMLLTAGTLQIVLAMIEAERIDPRLILDEPLEALLRWGHDPVLRARARTAAGRHFTAVELQHAFLDHAARFVADGGCEGIVPRAAEIVALWADTLAKLRARDFDALRGRIDWILKRHALERALERQPTLSWRSPALKVLDHRYASLDVAEGLHWAYRRAGVVERFVDDAHIARFEAEPPTDTRAWTRAMMLRLAGAARVDGVVWDWMEFTAGPGGRPGRRLDLPDPLGFTEAEVGHLFAGEPALDDVLDALGATATDGTSGAVVVLGKPIHWNDNTHEGGAS